MPFVEPFDLSGPSLSQDKERDSANGKDPQRRDGKLVAGWVHPPKEKRVFEQEM